MSREVRVAGGTILGALPAKSRFLAVLGMTTR